MAYNDLTGQRFNRLVAISKIGRTKDRQIIWQCLCGCEELTEIPSTALKKGYIKSCGCLQKERSRQANSTHGKSNSSWMLIFTTAFADVAIVFFVACAIRGWPKL